MDLNQDSILHFLREHKEDLERFSVRRIGLFGSFRHENVGEESDIDLLVELDQPTFDNYMDLKFYLEEHLGRTVDLVLRETLKPRLRPLVEQDVVYA